MKYGQELLDELKAQLSEHLKKSHEEQLRRSFEQFDDCSEIIHSRCDSITTDLLRAKIAILENKGFSSFTTFIDKDGNIADIKWVNTKFGGAYRIQCGESVSFTSSIKKLTTLGYHQENRDFPAWVCSKSDGSGFNGLTNLYVNYFKSDINYWTGENVK